MPSNEAIIKRQNQVVHSPRLSPPVMLFPDTATPLQPRISASARRPLPAAITMPARLLLLQHSYTPTGVTSAFSRSNQQGPISDSGANPFQETSLFRLLVCDTLSAPAVPAKKLPRPGKLPTSQHMFSPVLVEPWAAAPTIFCVQTHASSSIETDFSTLMQQPAAPVLAEAQDARLSRCSDCPVRPCCF